MDCFTIFTLELFHKFAHLIISNDSVLVTEDSLAYNNISLPWYHNRLKLYNQWIVAIYFLYSLSRQSKWNVGMGIDAIQLI